MNADSQDTSPRPVSRYRPAVTADRLPLPPGRSLGDRLQVLHHRSSDAIGATVVALDRAEGRRLTVRVLVPLETGRSSDPHGLHRLGRVQRKVREIAHVGVMRPHGTFPEEVVRAPSAVIVYDHISEPSLAVLLDRGGPLPVPAAVAIVDSVAEALSVAHGAGIFHLRIDTDCVFLHRDELGSVRPTVHVTDIGVVDAVRQAAPRVLLPLDPRTTAPEVLGTEAVDARADVYGLGALLWTLVGRGATEVPPGVTHVIERATAMHPQDRYGSVLELRDALLAALEGRPDDPTTRTSGGAPHLGPLQVPRRTIGAPGIRDDPSSSDASGPTLRDALIAPGPSTGQLASSGVSDAPSLVPADTRYNDEDDRPRSLTLLWVSLAVAPFLVGVAALAIIGLGAGSWILPGSDRVAAVMPSGQAEGVAAGGASAEDAAVGTADTVEEDPVEEDPVEEDPVGDDTVDGSLSAPVAGTSGAEPEPEPETERAVAEPEPAATKPSRETAPAAPLPPRPLAGTASGSDASPASAAPPSREPEPVAATAAPPPRAAPTPAPAAHTSVTVRSTPAGAVLFDGETILGNTPLEVSLGDGPRELRVWLPGHATQAITLSGDAPTLEVVLPPESSAAP